MRKLRALFLRLAGLFDKKPHERDLAAELESHLQLHIEDNLRAGLSAEEARRQALIRLGGLEQTKEAYRDRKGLPMLETFLRDFRYAGRVLRRNTGFSIIVIFTLALGIGANTAIFSVLESQLWRPLPFPDSERLVDIHVVLRNTPRQWDVITNSMCIAWTGQSHVFSSLGVYNSPSSRNLTAGGTSERVRVMEITSSLFKTLGVPLEMAV